MALSTYQGILDSIPVWLHRTGDPDVMAVAPDMVALAESEIYSRLRTRDMEARLESVIATGAIPVPANYTDLKFAYIVGDPVQNLTRKSADYILSQYANRGANRKPEFIARDVDTFIFGPYPDSNYTVKGVYYRSLPSIAITGSGALLTRYPKTFFYGALKQAEGFIRNDPYVQSMLPVWNGQFNQAIDEAQGEDDREGMSGGRARMNIVGYVP